MCPEFAAVPSTSLRVALLSEDAVMSSGVPIRISDWSRATWAGLGHDEVFHFRIVVGKAKAMEHGGGVENAFAHLRVGHRPGAVHAGHVADSGRGEVGRI